MGPDELASLGLAPPRVDVRIFGEPTEGGSPPLLAEVEIGNAVEGRGIFAKRNGASTVYVLPMSMVERIPTSEKALLLDAPPPPETEEAADEAPSDAPTADPLEGVEIP